MVQEKETADGIPRTATLRDEVRALRRQLKYGRLSEDTKKHGKEWKPPYGWRRKLNRSKKLHDKIVVLFLNKEGVLEPPKIVPVDSSNIVIIKGRPYEFDPRGIWRWKKWNFIIIKEIDRRLVSNLDWDEIKARGDATDSDEILIKAVMKAIEAGKGKGMSKIALVILILLIIGVIIFLFASGTK